MEYKIYLCEDDAGIADGISQGLSRWGMDVMRTRDFKRALNEIGEYAPHLILMDITLPYMNGYHLCTEIRRESSVPIIFISSASDNMNIIMAMNMGGDDFVSKPFDINVLVAKIQALLRRSYDFTAFAPTIEYKGAVLNTDDNTLTFNGEKISLTKNEYRILLVLMQNKGKTVSREKLMQELWETDSFVDENTLSVNVARLRKKLEAMGLTDFIETKFGLGYIVN